MHPTSIFVSLVQFLTRWYTICVCMMFLWHRTSIEYGNHHDDGVRGKKGRWRNFSGSVADCQGAFPSEPVVPPLIAFEYSYLNIKTHPHELIWLFSIYWLRHERLLCNARGTGAQMINYVYCHGTKALSQLLNNCYNYSFVCQFKTVLFNIKLGVPYVYAFYAGNQNAST